MRLTAKTKDTAVNKTNKSQKKSLCRNPRRNSTYTPYQNFAVIPYQNFKNNSTKDNLIGVIKEIRKMIFNNSSFYEIFDRQRSWKISVCFRRNLLETFLSF